MLTKMGWSEGHGLGSTLQGETSHVKVKKKKHGHGIFFYSMMQFDNTIYKYHGLVKNFLDDFNNYRLKHSSKVYYYLVSDSNIPLQFKKP